MISRIRFCRIRPSRKQTTIGLCSTLILIAITAFFAARLSHAANHRRQHLTFEDRVAAQRAIEEVYWRHRLWPTENPQPKPPLDEVMPDAAIRAKVEDYLRKSAALEVYWQRPITPDQLQAEMERMARGSKQPEVLRELWAALGDDPTMIAECLARPVLVERLLIERYEENDQQASFDEWWAGASKQMGLDIVPPRAEYALPQIGSVDDPCAEAWAAIATTNAPSAYRNQSIVWTGSEMIIWGGRTFTSTGTTINTDTGARYTPTTDSWTATSLTNAPFGREFHTAVWTGTQMIIWGGYPGVGVTDTGGRYNPQTNTWTAVSTTSAPSARGDHTAVWTGSVMVVWGGTDSNYSYLNSGARYNPATNTWTATSTTNTPLGRYAHTAVWTGTEMIVWGGLTSNSPTSGGRYSPASDTWVATSTTGAPSSRNNHTALWTGSEMIVWGGINFTTTLNSGGRYNPATNAWAATSTTGAPSPRSDHAAVWTGTEMIIWGNQFGSSSGGRYDPLADAWAAVSITGAPSGPSRPKAVWTGNIMIVAGGTQGGKYTPPLAISSTDRSFPATGASGSARVTAQQSCVWTATSNVAWLAVTSGSSGSGNGTVNFTVAANTNAASRNATLTIAGQTFTVTQAGCMVTISPASQSFEPIGGTGSITVAAAGGCNWTATSDAAWITITSGSSGSGAGAVNFSVAAHTGATTRTGTLTVAGQTFTVTQTGCAFSLDPASQVFAVAGGNGSVSVTTGGCNWTATSNANWLTISGASSGNGNGTVNYLVAANASGAQRSGVLTIAGQVFTVTQVAFDKDVGAVDIELSGAAPVNKPVTIRVRVTNFGSVAQSSFTVSYQINNENPITENFAGTLAPLQSATKVITTAWTPTVIGPHQITARTNLSGDENTANDSTTTTVQVVRAQYRGSWQGTTSNNRPVRFTVDENDVVTNLEVDVLVTIFVPPASQVTCAYTLRGKEPVQISNGQFSVQLVSPPTLGFIASAIPSARGTFTSPTSSTGRVDDFRVGLALCGGTLTFGDFGASGPTWSAQRQILCPTVSGIAPTSGMVGSSVTITGANLAEVSAVKFANNVTAQFVVNSDTQLMVTAPADATTGPITLSKAGCNDVQTAPFTVQPSPAPNITSISPLSATAGGATFPLTVNGASFINGSIVRWNGNARTTTFVSSAQLTAAIPASDLATPGVASVTVFNPAPGGGVSNTLSFTINPSGYEADVAPRPTGSNDGTVTVSDWTQTGRFVAGLDTPAGGSEFQRADCAPRSSLGDGRLTTADWVQAGRYAAGSDPVVVAGGPIAPSGLLAAVGAQRRRAVDDRQRPMNSEPRAIRLAQPRAGEFIVELDARGDENALGFSLQFDPGEWSLVSAATGRDAEGASLHVNAAQSARGHIGVALALAAGQRLTAGARQIVIVRLAARGGRGAIEFSDYPVKREVVDAEANVTPSAFAPAIVSEHANRKQK